VFTQTIPLPDGGGVFEALEAAADFVDLAGAAAGAGADELAAGGGVAAAGAEPDAEVELALEPDAALVFVLRLFFAGAVDESPAAELLEESADAGCVLASADVFFDRVFLALVEVSAVLVDAAEESPDADFEDFEDRVFFAVAESVAEPDAAEVSVAADSDDLDFFDLLAEVSLLESAASFADESPAAVFFLDLLLDVAELPEELSAALVSEFAVVFFDFFLLVVLLLLLASDC
jgi:hypothetical protein